MTFVFVVGYVLGYKYKSQYQWRKFTVRVGLGLGLGLGSHQTIHLLCLISQVEDYKLNVRCFNVFQRKHKQVFTASLQYQTLPDSTATPPRKRHTSASALSSDSPAPKVKKTYDVTAELTESDDEE